MPSRQHRLLTANVLVAATAAGAAGLGTPSPAAGGTPTCLGAPVTVFLAAGDKPTGRDDVILGTSGDDTIFGFRGNDRICGLGGSDVIQGGGGDDVVDAGTGADWASYGTSPQGVTVSLGIPGPQDTGPATGTDTLTGFEALTGSAGSDTLTGDSNGNSINGLRGDDTIDGAAGQDTIRGSLGQDFCDGGPDFDWARGCETVTSVP